MNKSCVKLKFFIKLKKRTVPIYVLNFYPPKSCFRTLISSDIRNVSNRYLYIINFFFSSLQPRTYDFFSLYDRTNVLRKFRRFTYFSISTLLHLRQQCKTAVILISNQRILNIKCRWIERRMSTKAMYFYLRKMVNFL